MKRLILFLLFLFGAFCTASAQISGRLIDETSHPIAYATVSLLNAQDSIPIRSVLSSDSGTFKFDPLPQGKYLLQISNLGYQIWRSALIGGSAQDFGTIRM